MKIDPKTQAIVDKMVECFLKMPPSQICNVYTVFFRCGLESEEEEAERHLYYFRQFEQELKRRKIKFKVVSDDDAWGLPYLIRFYYRPEKTKGSATLPPTTK